MSLIIGCKNGRNVPAGNYNRIDRYHCAFILPRFPSGVPTVWEKGKTKILFTVTLAQFSFLSFFPSLQFTTIHRHPFFFLHVLSVMPIKIVAFTNTRPRAFNCPIIGQWHPATGHPTYVAVSSLFMQLAFANNVVRLSLLCISNFPQAIFFGCSIVAAARFARKINTGFIEIKIRLMTGASARRPLGNNPLNW